VFWKASREMVQRGLTQRKSLTRCWGWHAWKMKKPYQPLWYTGPVGSLITKQKSNKSSNGRNGQHQVKD